MPTDRELAHALGITERAYRRGKQPPPPRTTAAGVYDVTLFGARPSPHDSTAAIHAACSAARVTGGEVVFPPGVWRLREHAAPFADSGGYGERSIWLRGAGKGLSTLLWDPPVSELAQPVLTWGDGTEHYVGGGLRDLLIRSNHAGATGDAVTFHRVIRTAIYHSWIAEFHAANGVRIYGAEPSQNVTLFDVELQACRVGIDARGADFQLHALRLNQNHHRAAILRSGGPFNMIGAMVQGGEGGPGTVAVEVAIGATAGGITVQGCHFETEIETLFKLNNGTNNIRFDMNSWLGRVGQRLIDATQVRGIHIAGSDVRAGGTLLKCANRCSGLVHDAPRVASAYDMDSSCRFLLFHAQEDPPEAVTGAKWVAPWAD